MPKENIVENADVYKSRGDKNMKSARYDLAIINFSKAIELKPDDADLYISRGAAYCNLDNENSAISDFTKAIELSPENAEAYDRRGLSYVRKSKDYTLAIADYSRAIEIDNNMASAYEHRGNAYTATGKYDLAIVDLTEAIELRPEFVEDTYYSRGETYKKKGDYNLAIADITKAIELGVYNSDEVQETLNDALKKKEAQDNGEEIIETEEIKAPEKARFWFHKKVHFGKNGFEIKDFFEDEPTNDYRNYRIATDIKILKKEQIGPDVIDIKIHKSNELSSWIKKINDCLRYIKNLKTEVIDFYNKNMIDYYEDAELKRENEAGANDEWFEALEVCWVQLKITDDQKLYAGIACNDEYYYEDGLDIEIREKKIVAMEYTEYRVL